MAVHELSSLKTILKAAMFLDYDTKLQGDLVDIINKTHIEIGLDNINVTLPYLAISQATYVDTRKNYTDRLMKAWENEYASINDPKLSLKAWSTREGSFFIIRRF